MSVLILPFQKRGHPTAVLWSCLLLLMAQAIPQDMTAQDLNAVPRVHSSRPQIASERRWEVGTSPIFEAGRLGNSDALDLFGVRGVVRLNDGTTVVANSGQVELLFLSPSGSLVSRSGGRGDGPGEFRQIGKIGRYRGDSVFAMDYARGALSFFNSSGQFGRSLQLHSLVEHGYWPAGALADGRMVFFSDAFMIGGGAFPQDSTWAFILDLETLVADTIGRFPKSDAGNPPGALALGPTSVMTVGAGNVYWGRGDAFEFREYTGAGELQRIISKRWEPIRVTDKDWDRHGQARFESLRRSRSSNPEELVRRARQEHERIDHAEHLPAFITAFVDSQENLWVREYPLTGVHDASWFVFSPDGQWVTTLEMPFGFSLYDAGPDWVIGIYKDELDVEVVQLRPLLK